ncbi:hypothetical protein F4782DRAFT_349465 [Xylaria castorea]|nr:hypothetical protein F4782DRAFT_349465 [Xylaria castorea]
MSYSTSDILEIASQQRRHDNRPGILDAKYLRFVGLQASEVEYLLAHPKAEVLEFHSCYWDIRDGNPKSTHGAARVVRLIGTTIKDTGLNEVLCRFPKLRSLVYYRPSDEVDTCFDEMGRELTKHGQHLEHLELVNEALMPFYTEFGSLHKLINLKSLEIDLEFLIGFRENPREYDDYMDAGFDPEEEELDYEEINREAGDWSLVKMLPHSLEKLTIHIEYPKLEVYFNTYERYGAKFEELLTAEGQFDNLRWVNAPRLNTVAEKLCGRSTEWALLGNSKCTMARTPRRTEAKADASDSSVADTETIA